MPEIRKDDIVTLKLTVRDTGNIYSKTGDYRVLKVDPNYPDFVWLYADHMNDTQDGIKVILSDVNLITREGLVILDNSKEL